MHALSRSDVIQPEETATVSRIRINPQRNLFNSGQRIENSQIQRETEDISSMFNNSNKASSLTESDISQKADSSIGCELPPAELAIIKSFENSIDCKSIVAQLRQLVSKIKRGELSYNKNFMKTILTTIAKLGDKFKHWNSPPWLKIYINSDLRDIVKLDPGLEDLVNYIKNDVINGTATQSKLNTILQIDTQEWDNFLKTQPSHDYYNMFEYIFLQPTTIISDSIKDTFIIKLRNCSDNNNLYKIFLKLFVDGVDNEDTQIKALRDCLLEKLPDILTSSNEYLTSTFNILCASSIKFDKDIIADILINLITTGKYPANDEQLVKQVFSDLPQANIDGQIKIKFMQATINLVSNKISDYQERMNKLYNMIFTTVFNEKNSANFDASIKKALIQAMPTCYQTYCTKHAIEIFQLFVYGGFEKELQVITALLSNQLKNILMNGIFNDEDNGIEFNIILNCLLENSTDRPHSNEVREWLFRNFKSVYYLNKINSQRLVYKLVFEQPTGILADLENHHTKKMQILVCEILKDAEFAEDIINLVTNKLLSDSEKIPLALLNLLVKLIQSKQDEYFENEEDVYNKLSTAILKDKISNHDAREKLIPILCRKLEQPAPKLLKLMGISDEQQFKHYKPYSMTEFNKILHNNTHEINHATCANSALCGVYDAHKNKVFITEEKAKKIVIGNFLSDTHSNRLLAEDFYLSTVNHSISIFKEILDKNEISEQQLENGILVTFQSSNKEARLVGHTQFVYKDKNDKYLYFTESNGKKYKWLRYTGHNLTNYWGKSEYGHWTVRHITGLTPKVDYMTLHSVPHNYHANTLLDVYQRREDAGEFLNEHNIDPTQNFQNETDQTLGLYTARRLSYHEVTRKYILLKNLGHLKTINNKKFISNYKFSLYQSNKELRQAFFRMFEYLATKEVSPDSYDAHDEQFTQLLTDICGNTIKTSNDFYKFLEDLVTLHVSGHFNSQATFLHYMHVMANCGEFS